MSVRPVEIARNSIIVEYIFFIICKVFWKYKDSFFEIKILLVFNTSSKLELQAYLLEGYIFFEICMGIWICTYVIQTLGSADVHQKEAQ
jgi:hypothetical protein